MTEWVSANYSLFKKESLPFFGERWVCENISAVYHLIDASNSIRNLLDCFLIVKLTQLSPGINSGMSYSSPYRYFVDKVLQNA